MRIIEICTVGAAAAYLALSYSHAGTGLPHAVAYVLAILVGVVTVSLAIALGTHSWPEEPGLVVAGPRILHRCHGCGSRMRQERSAWVCLHCDRSPVAPR